MSIPLIPMLTAALFLGLAVCEWIIEYKFSDRRTTTHRMARHVLLLLIVLTGCATILTLLHEHRQSQREAREMRDLAVTDRVQAATERRQLERRLLDLQKRLDPFLEASKNWFPREDRDSALHHLAEQVRHQVRGVVQHADTGEPIMGAGVRFEGYRPTRTTDSEGEFSLPIPTDVRLGQQVGRLVVRAHGFSSYRGDFIADEHAFEWHQIRLQPRE